MPDFNSENWFPLIERLADKYYDRAEKGFVYFKDDALQRVKLAYKERSLSVKSEVFEDPAASRIDRHKILALYVQLLLENQPFVHHDLKTAPRPTKWTMLMNEMFCLDIMTAVLTSWTGKTLDRVKFDEYKSSFLKLLGRYRSDHAEFHKYNLYFTYTFAHLIYFLERDFFV